MAASSSSNLPHDEQKTARKMKPYECVLCKRAFCKAMNLQKHMMDVHNVMEESDDEEEEEEDHRDNAGCIERPDEDGTNLFADAAASVLGDLSGDSRDTDVTLANSSLTENFKGDTQTDCDQHVIISTLQRDGTVVLGYISEENTDEVLSGLHPTESTQDDPQMEAKQNDAESDLHSDSTVDALQGNAHETIETALQVNPSDIIAQAAAGANILIQEKDSDLQDTQSVEMEAQRTAQKDCMSDNPEHAGVMNDNSTLFLDPSSQGQTATCPEDGVGVHTDGKGLHCNEMISQILPVEGHQAKVPPALGSAEGSCETPTTAVAADETVIADSIAGKVQITDLHVQEKVHKKKMAKSPTCRGRSCHAAQADSTTSSDQVLRLRKRTLGHRPPVSANDKQKELGCDSRPQLQRSRRSSRRKIPVEKDFMEGKRNQMDKQTEKKKGEEKDKKEGEKRKKNQKSKKKKRKLEEKKKEKKTKRGEMKGPNRELPEKPQECTGRFITRRRRKTLQEKLADLRRAHEETEKLNILVQKIISDSPGGRMEAEGTSQSKRKSFSLTKTKTKKMYDCLSCQEKFSSLSECVDHMRNTHLDQKRSGEESDKASSSDVSSTLEEEEEDEEEEEEEEEEEDDDGDVEEIPKTAQDSSPLQTTKSVPKQKGSSRGGEFSCKYCSEVSKSLEGQRAHMSVHCGLVAEKCFKCKIYETRPTAAQLKDIERSVEEVRDATNSDSYEFKHGKRLLVQFFQCIVCNSCFAVEKHLRNHMSQHEVIVCQVCSAVFSSTQALGKHIPHHRTGPLTCRTCGQTFFSSYMLLLHMRGHTKDFRCKHCDATFMFPANLLRHIRQRHANNTSSEPASVDNVAIQQGRSSKHKDHTRGTKDNTKLNCKFCGNLHCSEETLKRHIERYHPERVENRGKYVCEICGTVRHKYSQLKAHMICHKQPIHKCHLCSKVFRRLASLKQHLHQVHAGRRDFTCQYCSKRISSFTSLQDHERLHTGEKPFVCLECGKSFRVRQMYKTHLRTEHSKDKPFRCSQCDKCFSSCTSLAKHKKIHNPQEDSICPHCGKLFKRKDLLRMHLVQHRQPMQCFKCNRSFSSDIALMYHMNKLHKINLYRTGYVQVNFPNGSIPTPQSHISSAGQSLIPVTNTSLVPISDTSEGLTNTSPPAEKSPISLTTLSKQTDLGDSPGDGDNSLVSSQAVMEPASNLPLPYGTDRRLSDPTNVAISTILSQFFDRTLTPAPE